ncbi:MAG: hypothetical protein LUG95_03870 [Clostridiales bacterium]|nr:hypothetical protein [Clostridiales bacterium]
MIQKSNDDIKSLFPFDYELKIKYILNGNTLTNEYIVSNVGDCPMPFQIGGHPAFNCPLDSDESFEDYKVVFSSAITSPCLRPDHTTGLVDSSEKYDVMQDSDTLCLKHDLFEENDALIFKDCQADSALLIGKNGKGVRIDFPDMDNLLVWSAVGNAPFVALEPWTGTSDSVDSDGIFEHKSGVKILNAGKKISLRFKITLI